MAPEAPARPAPTGVVVMAYGTPKSPDDVAEYYTHIRRGNPPPPDLLADLQARYDAIGGTSPLAERTEAQRSALASALDRRAPGEYRVVLGQKHAAPFIEDAVAELAAAGVQRGVGLVLAPHYSRASVGEYLTRLTEAATATGMSVARIESWHLEPEYLDFLADALRTVLDVLPVATKVVFTAHSLPERALVGDPYPGQASESAAEVAARVGLTPWRDTVVAWQSAGRTGDAWRGPDVLDVIRRLATTGAVNGVAVCPQGFVADHLEVLYDLDIEAQRVADEVGLEFARSRSLNDDPTVMDALARRVIAADRAEP